MSSPRWSRALGSPCHHAQRRPLCVVRLARLCACGTTSSVCRSLRCRRSGRHVDGGWLRGGGCARTVNHPDDRPVDRSDDAIGLDRLNHEVPRPQAFQHSGAAWLGNGFANDSPNLRELPGTCAHFIVAQSGDVWQIVSTSVMCRHTIGLNDKAIGIEIVQRAQGNGSHWADQQILGRPAQIGAVLALVRSLQRTYGIRLSNIVGHATANEAPQFRDLEGWRNDHTDWQAQDVLEVRRRLAASH